MLKDISGKIFLNLQRLYLALENNNFNISLCAILLLGLILRVYRLDYQSLWIDELYSIVPVNPINDLSSLIHQARADQPPLHAVLLYGFFHLVDYNEFNGRLLSVIFGMGGIVSMYFLGKEVLDKRAGIFCAFLTSLNYFHIYYSQELRFYSLLFFLTALSFIFFIRALKSRQRWNYISYFLSTAALMYTHYYGLLIAFIQAVIVILFFTRKENRNKKFVYSWGALFLMLLVVLTPWLATIVKDIGITSFWIGKPDPIFFLSVQFDYFGNDFLVVYIILILLLLPLYIFCIDRKRLFSLVDRRIVLILATWICLSLLLPYLYSIWRTPILYPRYTLVTLPAICLVASIAFCFLQNVWVRACLVAVIFVSTAFQFKMVNGYYYNLRYPQVREALNSLTLHYDGKSRIISKYEWWLNFYLRNTNPRIWIKNPQSLDFKSQIQGEEYIWLVSLNGVALDSTDQKLVDSLFIVEKRLEFWQAAAIRMRRRNTANAGNNAESPGSGMVLNDQ